MMRFLLFTAFSLLSSLAFATTTIKVATLTPDGSFWMQQMRQAAEDISQKTDGRVKFRFYPGGVMGNDSAVLRKVRIGQLQAAAIPGGSLARFAPDTQIYNIPLLFNNYGEVDYIRSQMDKKIEKAFDDAGWVNFGLAEGGFAYVMSKNPIASVEDLQKNKIWAPSNDTIAKAAADTFHFSPIPLSVGDVLTGLQTDLVNTVTISPVVAISLQWHTQIHYITNLPLVYFYALMAVDKKVFDQISPADQTIVRQIMGKAFAAINKQNRIDNEAAFKALQDQGIKLVTPTPEQLAQWEKMTHDASGRFVQNAGINPALLSEAQKLLSEYRRQHAQ